MAGIESGALDVITDVNVVFHCAGVVPDRERALPPHRHDVIV